MTTVSAAAVERIVERALAKPDGGWSLERQVAGLVHDLATRNASGHVLVTLDDLDRVES